MLLTQEQKEQISHLIGDIEQKSSAELVAVIARKSGEYTHIWAFFALFCMFLVSFFALFFIDFSSLVLWAQLFTFSVIYLFCYLNENSCIRYLPKSFRYSKASDFAHISFHNLGLDSTKTKSAIMFFVSMDERYVKIITDSTIKAKLDDSYWQNIVDIFVQDVRKGKFTKGYLQAIQNCSETLIKHFPIQEDDTNELPNEVIELL